MSLKNEDTDDDRLALDDSPTPAYRYKKFFTKTNKNISDIIENTIPLYPQKLKTKSNSVSKIEGKHNQMSLPSIQKSRMATMMIKRKPVNLFANFSQEEKNPLNDLLIDKNESTYVNDKSEMNLDEQNDENDDCPHSKGFVNEDGIWEDPTLSQSESRCLQLTVGNIMKSNEEYDNDIKEKIENSNDKTLLWEFEDENKYDKENIIPDDYKGGILAEREWCDLSVEEDSVMEEYGNTNDDMIGSSSQTKSTLEKGKNSISNSMIKKSEHQHVRYAFQEISINSMPEYQMGLYDCYSVYSNSSFGSTCDSQKMATPKKGAGFKMNNSYSKSNEFNNSFNSNDNIDFDDSTPSFFNTLPLIKSLKGNPSTSSSRKSSCSKKLVYQLCGVPDINGIHKKSISKNKFIEKRNIEGEISYNSTSNMNSSPIISKSSILSPPFLLSSPVVRNGFSSPLVQTKRNSFNINNGDSIENYNPFEKKDTIETSVEKTPKARKVKSLLTTTINNSLSSDGENSKLLENTNTSESKTLPKDTNFEEEDKKITPKPRHIDSVVSIQKKNTSLESDHLNASKDIVFFPHYHSRPHNQKESNDISTSKGNKVIDDSLIDQTSNMMSISPTTLSKINQSHQNFLQSNQILNSSIYESPSSINLPKRSKNSVEDKKKELSNRRRARLKKYVF
jgi:hypothetical protein